MEVVYCIAEHFEGGSLPQKVCCYEKFTEAVNEAIERGWQIMSMPVGVDLSAIAPEDWKKRVFDPCAFFWTGADLEPLA